MNNVPLMPAMKSLHGPGNFTKATWLQTSLSSQCARSWDQHWIPDMELFPKVTSQLPGDRLIALDIFHDGRDRVWIIVNICLSCLGICFSYTHCFCQTTICEVTECLFHHHDISCNIVSCKKYRNVFVLRESAALTGFLTILMQLFWMTSLSKTIYSNR